MEYNKKMRLVMEYVTIKEMASNWGISIRRINTLCNIDRINGAYKNGSIWLIPKGSKKPEDKRRSIKNFSEDDIFKFNKLLDQHELSLDTKFKKENGIFYTPISLVDLIFNEIQPEQDSVLLDPCCGMGSFIIGALKRGMSKVYGVDIDSNTIDYVTSKLGIKNLAVYDSINNSANSTLETIGIYKPDYIIGNPPYAPHGSVFGNLFVGSLIRSLDMIKNGGVISYIIPKNFLHVSTYSDLRRIILKKYKIVSIVDLHAYFKNVRGEQIILTLKNENPSSNHKILIKSLSNNKFIKHHEVKQIKYDDIIRLFFSNEEISVYDKLTSTFDTLNDYCEGYIGRGKSRSKYAVAGKDLRKFGFKNAHIPNKGNKIFIQNIYSAESGVIGTFAGEMDAKETITVITDSNKEVCKYLLGLLHSRLCNYYLYKYCYNGSKLTAHTDKKYISQIPVVIDNGNDFKKMVNIVEQLEEIEYLSDCWYKKYEEMNELIYTIYGLNNNEKIFIEKNIKKIQSTRWIKNESR
jgi:16S rRNA G966 N2-methylase RsmD